MTRIKRIDNVLTGQGVEREPALEDIMLDYVIWSKRKDAHGRIDKLEQLISDAARLLPVTADHVCTRWKISWGLGPTVTCMDCGKPAPSRD